MEFLSEGTNWISEVGLAARNGNYEELKLLISEGRPVDVANNRGWCPLHELTASSGPGNLKCLEELLKCRNVDVNCRTHQGETALHLAVACTGVDEHYALQAVQMLLHAGANVNIPDNEGATPMLSAMRFVHQDTNLLHETAKNGRVDLMLAQALLASGAELDLEDKSCDTPLSLAVSCGNIECLRVLLEVAKMRSQLYLVDKPLGLKLFTITLEKGFIECVQLLLSYSSNITFKRVLYLAMKRKHHQSLKRLLKVMSEEADFMKNNCFSSASFESESKWARELNPLHVAVQYGSHGCLRILLEAGFPVDSLYWHERLPCPDQVSSYPRHYETPLSLALARRDIDAAKILLSAGANVDSCGRRAFSPFFSAVMYGTSKEIDLMLEHGADLTSPNLLLLALLMPQNICHLLRRGFDPSSCLAWNLSYFGNAILRIESQDRILRVTEMLVALVNHESKFSDFFMKVARKCESRFQVDYDTQRWSGIRDFVYSVASLKSLCRHSLLRRHRTNVGDWIDSLPLPDSLTSYLNFEGTRL